MNFPGLVELMRTAYVCKVKEMEFCLPNGNGSEMEAFLCVLAEDSSKTTCRSR